jgi:RNA polymerase sigma factor (sigma-70 family)
MSESTDHELLAGYAREKSEAAFAALVDRHVSLVYSVAWRATGNAHAAEEVTQAVFIILAQKAGRISGKTILSGWLHQTARLTAANYLRGEIRRQNREQEAYMQSTLNEPDAEVWARLAPLLDDALDRLGERDRNAIVLRFLENKSLREVGVALGAGEDAAKMRVNRALEKLRKIFGRRGVTFSAAAIAGAVAANSVQAAPSGLANTISAIALAKGASAGGSTLTLVKGALKIMLWTKAKTAIVAGVAVILAVGATTTAVIRLSSPPAVPRASWKFSGFGDPESAFMSYLWASVCQTNRAAFESTLTPEQKGVYAQMIVMNAKVPQPHSEEQTVLEEFQRANEQWKNGNYRIIGRQTVDANRVLLHIEARMAWQKMEVYVRMKKTRAGWRYDGIKARKILATMSRTDASPAAGSPGP